MTPASRLQDHHHRRRQRRLHQEARQRHPQGARVRRHRDRADRHQRAQPRDDRDRSSAASSRSTACRRRSPRRPTAARRSTAPATSCSCVRDRRARGLRRRHPHPAEVRRRPVRRRHHLRRRDHLRPAQHPGDARLLQGHPRGRRARRAVPQLRQPDGDERPGPAPTTAASRPSASATACRTAARQIAARPRHHAAHRPRHLLLRHQPPDLVHRR